MNSIASTAVLQGLEAMLSTAVADAVRKLVEAGLLSDADAAMRVLGGVVVRQEPIPIAALPWCGMVQDDKCIGITRGRHRLFTQCQGSRSHGEYCKKCKSIVDKNGTLPCGTTHTRLAADPMDYMGVQPFVGVMEQNNWTPEYVRFSVAHHGGTLDERNFAKAPKKSRRGRPTTTMPMAGPPLPIRPVDEDEAPEPPPEPVRAAEPAAEPDAESDAESEAEEADPTAEQISKMTKVQLAEVCAKYNISTLAPDGKPKKVAEIKSILLERFGA